MFFKIRLKKAFIPNKYLLVDFGMCVRAQCLNVLKNHLYQHNQIDRGKPSHQRARNRLFKFGLGSK